MLIECLRQALLQGELDFGKGETVILVTLTRTLVEYGRYIIDDHRFGHAV